MFGFLTIFIVCGSVLSDSLNGGDSANNVVTQKLNSTTYTLVNQAKNWTTARDSCAMTGGKLAVPKSEEEFLFIQNIVRGMHYPSIVDSDFKLMVWLGISNLENYLIWKTVDDINLEKVGFHSWAGKNSAAISDNPAEPHCVGMDAANHGLRDFWCHLRLAYICESKSNNIH
ncbi:unnamed protein product [Chilo suppressalis]|uniref:C-type lectin domain-containing protein n=1 Tax=Chilo suppressalis TaxID=168631 RepID=A0ABN8AVG3_CHISP|nr:unnamed protein product [Chilo suppressalis]